MLHDFDDLKIILSSFENIVEDEVWKFFYLYNTIPVLYSYCFSLLPPQFFCFHV